jgi:23S rRNA pseudouridine1911/1915/1917 synthase
MIRAGCRPGRPQSAGRKLQKMILSADAADRGKRLDAFLHARLPEYSRSRLQQWIREGRVQVQEAPAKPSYLMRGGERVVVEPGVMPPLRAEPEDIPLTVLYEDESTVVIDKPAGIAVHPGAGVHRGTVVNALLHRFATLSTAGGDLRPGIVHRLDRYTSGVLLIAKTDEAHHDLASQFAKRGVEKIYLALVEGRIEGSGRIRKPIARDPKNRARMTARLETGRPSLTDWAAIEHFAGFTLLRIRLGTGRTHQIRAHMAAIGHPVAGDRLYGAKASRWNRYFLHAHRLGFRSPSTGGRVVIESPLPPDLVEWKALLADSSVPAQR